MAVAGKKLNIIQFNSGFITGLLLGVLFDNLLLGASIGFLLGLLYGYFRQELNVSRTAIIAMIIVSSIAVVLGLIVHFIK